MAVVARVQEWMVTAVGVVMGLVGMVVEEKVAEGMVAALVEVVTVAAEMVRAWQGKVGVGVVAPASLDWAAVVVVGLLLVPKQQVRSGRVELPTAESSASCCAQASRDSLSRVALRMPNKC